MSCNGWRKSENVTGQMWPLQEGDSNVDYVLARAKGQMVPLIPKLSCTWARVQKERRKERVRKRAALCE